MTRLCSTAEWAGTQLKKKGMLNLGGILLSSAVIDLAAGSSSGLPLRTWLGDIDYDVDWG